MNTQNDEEMVLLEIFKNVDKGVFIDLGAFDGKTFSNTYALWQKGWRGVYCECSFAPLVALMNQIKEDLINRESILFTCPISDYNAQTTFYESSGDMVGSISKEHVKVWEKDVQFIPTETHTISIGNVLGKALGKYKAIDFISIDIEGVSDRILEQCLSVCPVICIEHDGKNVSYITELASKYDFGVVHKTSENLILVNYESFKVNRV